MLSINQVLQQGRYHIISRFEHAETGIIYQAFDNVLKTNVTITETSFDLKGSPNAAKYPIAKQIENFTSIKHDSFPQIHGYFSEVDNQYLVTESVEGQNLKEQLEKNKKPFTLFAALSWTEQLLDALNYLHSKNPPIIHGDVTPYQLTLAKNNKIKLLTLSIIKDFNKKQGGKNSDLYLPYFPLEVLWETLDYASQKVILNSYDEKSAEILESPADGRSDIYSLGATIYYLVTGKVPANALERSIDLLEGKEDPLISPSQLNAQMPRNVSTFLMKALELKRENRFESASIMRTALQPMLDLMKKIENETKKAVDDPKVRASALQEVELARQALRRQREEEQKKSQTVLNLKENTEKIVEEPISSEADNAPSTILQEIERAKQNLKQEQEEEKQKEQIEQPIQIEEKDSPIEEKAPLNVKPERVQTSILVAKAPVKVEEPIIEEVAVKEQRVETFADLAVEPKATTIVEESKSESFDFAQPERKSVSWLIPAVCGFVILLVAGFFGFKFLGSNNSANTAQPATEQKVGNEPAKSVETPQTQSNNPSSDTSAVSPGNTQEQSNSTLPTEESQKTPESVKNKKLASQADKKVTPTAKTPVPKKKEVTVDDIINDN